jgi:hypothetical protein
MLNIDYKEKLRGFNATPKYQAEMAFAVGLLDPKPHQKLMDYGCGLGTMMRYITHHYKAETFGFDVNDYYEGDQFYFRKSIYFPVDAVYFMHSFAHIPKGPSLEMIRDLMLSPGGKVVVITPNKVWLDGQDKTNYTPDPTVYKHYTLEELHGIFEEARLKIICSGEFGIYPKVGERLFILGIK